MTEQRGGGQAAGSPTHHESAASIQHRRVGKSGPRTARVSLRSQAWPKSLEIILSERDRFLAAAARMLHSREAARDVLQIALLKAVEGISSVRQGESAVSWFHRVLANAAIDYQRRSEVYHRALEKLASFNPNPAALTPEEDPCSCSYDVLPTLTPAYAAILRRVDLEDRPLEEVARHEGITVNNARVRLHRARRALRRRWMQTCGGSPPVRCSPCGCRRQGGEQLESASQ